MKNLKHIFNQCTIISLCGAALVFVACGSKKAAEPSPDETQTSEAVVVLTEAQNKNAQIMKK